MNFVNRFLTARRAALTVGVGVAAVSAIVFAPGCTITAGTLPADYDAGDLFDTGPIPTPDSGAMLSGDPACNTCLVNACIGQWSACSNQAECLAIYTCATATGCDGACVDACYAAHPAGRTTYYALALCDYYGACGSCATSCPAYATSCAQQPGADAGAANDATTTADAAAGDDAAVATDTGAPASDAGTAQDCVTCTDTQCATQKAGCAPSSDCAAYNACLATCADAACFDKCGTDHATGKVASTALGDCTATSCATACGF